MFLFAADDTGYFNPVTVIVILTVVVIASVLMLLVMASFLVDKK